MELSFLHVKGLLVIISINKCVSVPEDSVILANSADPDLGTYEICKRSC